MVEKMGYIKNPLTVVAIFAAIAEVSSTLVLPMLSNTSQAIFIWFVMGFPSSLVALFFLTLLTKHKVLYAPSDFQNDSSFVNLACTIGDTATNNVGDLVAYKPAAETTITLQ